MLLQENIDLDKYSTIRLGGRARYLIEVISLDDLIQAVSFAKQKRLPIIMLGLGSNSFFKDGLFNGLVIINSLKGIEFSQQGEDYLLSAGAGEVWDDLVSASVQKGLTGIECLSAIPGSAGGGPVQNIGAYGQEIAQTLIKVDAYDVNSDQMIQISNQEANFSYRDSLFKKNLNHFLITKIYLKLKKGFLAPPFYKSLEDYLSQHNISDYSPSSIREAVIKIRSLKLPNPKDFYNLGSFFKNPIIDQDLLVVLKKAYPDIPHWLLKNNKVKLSGAWLIQKAGYANYHDPNTGMSTWKNQPLVLVNELAKNVQDLLIFKDKIISHIQEEFGITLEQEPIMLP